MPPECQDKLTELKGKLGEPPKDLEWESEEESGNRLLVRRLVADPPPKLG